MSKLKSKIKAGVMLKIRDEQLPNFPKKCQECDSWHCTYFETGNFYRIECEKYEVDSNDVKKLFKDWLHYMKCKEANDGKKSS
ncbi:MAG: hypothetical protein HUJ63_09405 [Enterococcus sp.]|nr:hypothetical protein [Enterococcus sp.]